jgi:hypothetical protein
MYTKEGGLQIYNKDSIIKIDNSTKDIHIEHSDGTTSIDVMANGNILIEGGNGI